MNFVAVLDLSSIIWDKADFEANTDKYYGLVLGITKLIEKFDEERPAVLLRASLLNEMVNGFPMDKVPPQLVDFGTVIYKFLSDLGERMFDEYQCSENIKVASVPDLIKAHFNENTKVEIRALISGIHQDIVIEPPTSVAKVYFSFDYLWQSEDNLITISDNKILEHETITTDKENYLEDFFARFKNVFEHNAKHDRHKGERMEGGELVSPLSCYDGKDNDPPQELLDKAIESDNCYYNFDADNDVWVVFRQHSPYRYHAHDEKNEENIPHEVRKSFNK